MKKLLSVLALAGVFTVAGCSCSKYGEYEFESITLTVGDEEKTFTCTAKEIEDNPELEMVCPMYKAMEIELKKNGKAIMSMDAEDDENDYSQDVLYKIEDNKLYFRETKDDQWEETGTYKKGKIIFNLGEEVTVTFKKD